MSEAKQEKKQEVVKVNPFDDFKGQLDQRANEIAQMLPSTVTKEKFLATASAAIKQTPDLLLCTPRSLFAAITKAAQDGILPDGREGVITKYGTEAVWNPMTHGLRKRARELAGILIDAQVVHENDAFLWRQGDEPGIDHVPAKLGTPRGAMIGVYAIFKLENGVILGREVMDRDQVEMVRNQSKAKDSLMWTKFVSEGWRKSVIRRGIKAVPVSDDLENIVRRDDENFDFDAAPPKPKASEFERHPVRDNPALAEFITKANFANSLNDIGTLRKEGLAALPAELHGAFEEVCDARARQITASEAKTDGPSKDVEPEEAQGDPRDEQEDKAKDEEPTKVETPFQRGQRLLTIIKEPVDVRDVMETIGDELKGKELKLWNDLCQARFAELGGAGKIKTGP